MGARKTSADHTWLLAAEVPADPATVGQAVERGYLRVGLGVEFDGRVDVLDAYCSACRRTWDQVGNQPCEAAESNEHLRGGPSGRKKRNHEDHDCKAVGCVPDIAALAEAVGHPFAATPMPVKATGKRTAPTVSQPPVTVAKRRRVPAAPPPGFEPDPLF